jgi:ABC-type glycerol-3-phosphate transport system substrate-binding protein
MKKQLLVAMIPLLTIGLAACAVNSSQSSSSAAASSSSSASATPSSTSSSMAPDDVSNIITTPVTINLWSITGKTYQTQLNKYVEAFKAVEPNVTVNSTIISGSYTTIETNTISGFLSNDYPDLVQCYPDHVVDYLDYNKVVKLDDYMSNATYGLSADNLADYNASFIEEGQTYPIKGTYSVPWDKSSELMYWNQDALNGLNLSSIDATINSGNPLSQSYFDSITWEELFGKLCPALTTYNNSLAADKKILDTTDPKAAIFTYDSDDNLFITLAAQYGYDYTAVNATTGEGEILFNNTGLKTKLKVFNDAYKKGYIQTKGSYSAYTSDLFTTNKALFTVSSTAGASYNFSSSNPMNIGVGRIPHAEGRDPVAINQGPSICVLDHKDSNRALASWLFWRFMTNKANALAWALNTDYLPIRSSIYKDTSFKKAANPDLQDEKTYERLKALNLSYVSNITDELFLSPAFKGSSEARSQASKLMTWALTTSNYDTEVENKFETAVNDVKKVM